MRPGETNFQSDLLSQVISIDVERSGDWMPVEDLRTAAQEAVTEGANVALNLDKVDHLDASALQILLALDIAQKKQGRNLQLTNASPQLRQWFEFAGVADHFSIMKRRGE
jgi:anti-anti-sigma factor